MAAASLSLCASIASNLTLSPKQQSTSSFAVSLFSRFPSPKLSSNSIFSSRLSFLSLPKSSESETVLAEAEPPVSQVEPQPLEVGAVEAATEQAPNREEIFAVVMIGSRQYIVFPGRFIYTQRLKGANVNDKITLNKVLLVGTRTTTYIGKPVVTNAVVHATVEEQGLDSKVIVFKYKNKKKYRRNIGHRQPNTRIRINSILGYEDYPAVTLDSLNS